LSIRASARITSGQRCDDQRQEQKLPRDHRGKDQAGDHLERLAQQLAEQRVQAGHQILHVVGEAAHQVGRAVVGERGHVHAERPRKEELAELVGPQLRKPRHEHRVDYQKEVLDDRGKE
jgi:hypothetical protein